MFRDHFFVSRFANEIGPFIGILLHVIEFFRSIGVADVAPVLGSHAVIVMIVGCDGGAVTFACGVFKLRHEAETFEMGWGLGPNELGKSRVDVEKLGRLFGNALGNARPGEDEGNASAVIPEGVFAGDAFFSDVPSVVRP